MTTSVYKYKFTDHGVQDIRMPKDAALLTVAIQDGVLTVWARVDINQPEVARKFYVFGTGFVIPDDCIADFVGTAFDGPYVWHVFSDPETYQ